jgi:DNA-binding NarL/FixJ family response regulator
LIKAIRDVMQGKPQLHPDIVRRLMTAVTEKDEKPVNIQHHLSSELQQLTEREREVLEQIARGLSNREIAEKMFISEKTVKTHVSNVLDKLGMEDRTRAAIWALKHGLGSED